MGSEKRERQKENRRYRLEAEAAAWRRRQRNRRLLWLSIAAFVVALVVVVVNVFGEDDEGEEATSTTTVPTTPTTPLTAPPPGEAIEGETPCPAEDGSSARTTSFENPPPTCIDPDTAYDAIVTTDVGEFRIELDAEAAPETVNSFVVLARYHYFDGVPFHRVIPDFVVQGGDPVGDPPGTGDPGYSLPDELPESVEDYVEGSVAMANSGPNTSGSQFFVWLGPNPLPGPNYSLFGQVVEGLDIVQLIEADGTAEGTPARTHVIQSVEIVERDSSATTTSAPGDTTTTAGDTTTTAADATTTTGG
jgi:cyclophilin family peptidyl-prolyl cis-trans isomerase